LALAVIPLIACVGDGNAVSDEIKPDVFALLVKSVTVLMLDDAVSVPRDGAVVVAEALQMMATKYKPAVAE